MKLVRKLEKTNKDQFILTIPKTLVQLLKWKNKDEIEFGFEKGKITITKEQAQKSRAFPAKGKRGEKR